MAVLFIECLHEVPVVLARWNLKADGIWEERIFFDENSGKMEKVGEVWVDTERATGLLLETEVYLGVCKRIN